MKPEELARKRIDDLLAQAGWVVQDRDNLNLSAARGIAIREFELSTGPKLSQEQLTTFYHPGRKRGMT